jgi:hypothetical protein
VAARRRQRPDQAHVEVGETAVRYRNLCRLQVYVSVNLPRWHCRQALAIWVMALAICGQQNRAVMRRRVARTPGWCIKCSDWKTASLCWIGTSGRNTHVKLSPSSVVSPTAWVVICNAGELVISATSGQDRWAAAIAEKLTGCASAMAARMGRSGAASPSSGHFSAAEVGEGR